MSNEKACGRKKIPEMRMASIADVSFLSPLPSEVPGRGNGPYFAPALPP